MSPVTLKRISLVFLIFGFTLWAYGFSYGSFWYANSTASLLEPLRLWVSDCVGTSIRPGLMEQFLGLFTALLGMIFRLAAQ